MVDIDLGSLTSGVGRWQSEKDITSAPSAPTLFTLNLRFPLLPFQLAALSLFLFLSVTEASLCLWMVLLGKKLSRYNLGSPNRADLGNTAVQDIVSRGV